MTMKQNSLGKRKTDVTGEWESRRDDGREKKKRRRGGVRRGHLRKLIVVFFKIVLPSGPFLLNILQSPFLLWVPSLPFFPKNEKISTQSYLEMQAG